MPPGHNKSISSPIASSEGKDISLSPGHAEREDILLSPEPSKDKGISPSPEYAEDKTILLPPEPSKDKGFSSSPEYAEGKAILLPPELSKDTSSGQALCGCCSQNRPYHPTADEIKLTSVVQESGKFRRRCPLSIFETNSWVSYCLQKGTISCFFCKRSWDLKLVEFNSHSGKDSFCTQSFADWKKCYEKLKKHELTHSHKEAVMKVQLHESKTDVACMLNNQLESVQQVRLDSLLKQLSSMRFLGRQGIGVRGHTEDESNLIQLLKTRAEDVPYLHQWIK